MLRLSRHDADTGRAVLVLEGRFVDAWADVLERECAEAERSGLAVALDLSEVRYVSPAALAAVARLCRRGVAIAACPPLIAEMLEQEGIDVGRCGGRHGDRPVR
jgi:anti-anti-sigma regulatory factor